MSGLFGQPSQSQQVQVYTGIQVSTSMYGGAIPLVYGTQRLPFNLIWYGNFTSTANSSGGGKGGGGGGKSYSYSTAFAAALCLGPIASIRNVWHDKSLQTLTSENLSLSLGGSAPATWSYLTTYTPPQISITGYIAGNLLTVVTMGNGSLQLGQLITNGGVAAGTQIIDLGAAGGGLGTYVVSGNQTVGSVGSPVSMTAAQGATGSQAVPYDHIAYVATSNYNLGSSASMPNLTFETVALLAYSVTFGMLDADPSAVIVDYLTDVNHGAGFQGSFATLQGSTNTYQSYCMAMGLLTSPLEDNQRTANEFLKELMQCTNSDIVLSVGQVRVIQYTDVAVSGTTPDGSSWSYTPNFTPLYSFTDSDYVAKDGEPPVKLTRKPTADTYNVVNIEYKDRANAYNTALAAATDEGDIARTGSTRVMSTLSLHQITTGSVARTVAQLILQQSLYERNSVEFKVRADYSLLEPGDIIALTDANIGYVSQVCRITQVEDDKDNQIKITAMEVPGTTRATPVYAWNTAQGYSANYGTPAGLVQAPQIFMMPSIPQALTQGIAIGIAVCGPSGSPYWGGCNVYCSTDGGTTYGQIGVIGVEGAGKYGTITATLAAGTADPDVTNTIAVTLNNTLSQLDASTHADADAMRTLALIDTGTTAEIISYGTATLVTAGQYTISYLHRGLYGSVNQSHSSSVRFVRLDGSIFQVAVDPGMAGQTLSFKFLSFNTWGTVTDTLASATAYTYTVPAGTVNGETLLIPRGSASLQDVSASGVTVYRNSGTAGWNSDCYSEDAFAGGCTVTATYLAGQQLAVGLVASTASILNPTTNMDYAIYTNASGGHTQIMQGGTTIATLAAPAVGDAYRITYDGSYVRYFVNGTVVQQTYAKSKVLFAALALNTATCSFGGVTFSPLAAATPYAWLTVGNAVSSTQGFSKQGGSSAWDSCGYSIDGYQTCHIAGKVNTAADKLIIGLSTSPTTSASNTNASYGWYADGTNWNIVEAGTTVVASVGAVSTADQVSITYDAANVKYYLNNILEHTTAIASLTLFGFIPIFAASSGMNSLLWGPTISLDVSDSAQIGANAATITAINTSVTTGSGVTGFTGLSSTGVVVNPSGPKFACTVIVTATIQARQTVGTVGQMKVLVRFADDGATYVSAGHEEPVITSTFQAYTMQWQFSHTAANAGTGQAGIWIDNTGPSTNSMDWQSPTIQVEYIIR